MEKIGNVQEKLIIRSRRDKKKLKENEPMKVCSIDMGESVEELRKQPMGEAKTGRMAYSGIYSE